MQMNQFDSITRKLDKNNLASFFHRNLRRTAFLFVGIVIGVALAIVITRETGQDQTLISVLTGWLLDTQWRRYAPMADDLLVAFGVILLISLVPVINNLFSSIDQTINDWRHTRFRVVKIQNLELLTPNQLANILVVMAKYLRFAVLLLVASISMTLIFSLSPLTEGLARVVLDRLVVVLTAFWEKLLSFIPNLVTLLFIALITRMALKVLHFFYDGLQRGKVRYDGIHPELIEPTYQIARFLIVAFALVAAFPYIPGSSSPVFKGLSIFVGFLLSLGSTSMVTNIVSGIVLTYTRGLKIGDRVQINDSTGDVIDRTLLVTRVRTIKNVIISIPNAIVMKNMIVNYSTEADEKGLILHTSVTIGYDVPWRQVHQLLIQAAQATPDVLDTPHPFVLQTSLDDFYISYELNAYTAKAQKMAVIYSELHQNILDQFNQAGVEIMSPSYMALRDGGAITIPQVEPPAHNGNGQHPS
ncbi:MAG: mechanosensitive ion channel [Anaerolineales bacterium]|jgi:small-conductance mechanosensitive channel